MKILTATALAMSLAFSLSACGGGGAVGAVEDWAGKSCSCKDKECAEKQKVEFDKIESKYRKEIKEWSESDEKKADKAYRKGKKCLQEFDVHAG